MGLSLTCLDGHDDLRRRADEALRRWDEELGRLRAAAGGSRAFRVVISGQQNSGKSTMANALVGAFDHDIFEVADRIVTKGNQEFAAPDGVTYVDTPGFGTTDRQDTRHCREAWRGADLVLFLHSSFLGGRDQQEEMDMLRELAAYVPDPAERVLLVCTKKGERDEEAVRAIAGEFSEAAREILGSCGRAVAVDSNDYRDGMREHDEELVRWSGVEEVRSWIRERRSLPSPQDAILEREREAVLSVLREIPPILERERREARQGAEERGRRWASVWAGLRDGFVSAWNNCHDKRIW